MTPPLLPLGGWRAISTASNVFGVLRVRSAECFSAVPYFCRSHLLSPHPPPAHQVACHQYNLKFLVYQGYDLGDGSQLSIDGQFRVSTPCGDIGTDPFQNSLAPKWNTKLQVRRLSSSLPPSSLPPSPRVQSSLAQFRPACSK